MERLQLLSARLELRIQCLYLRQPHCQNEEFLGVEYRGKSRFPGAITVRVFASPPQPLVCWSAEHFRLITQSDFYGHISEKSSIEIREVELAQEELEVRRALQVGPTNVRQPDFRTTEYH